MGDTVENNQVNSCSYEEYSDLGLSSSAPLASFAAEPAVDLTVPRPDNYSEPLRLPTHLSAHDSIRIADGQGGSRTLELIELVREARSDAGARSQLLTLAQAAASDPRVQGSCFLGSEENLLPILAQLASSDPTLRHEGALSLKQLIHSSPADRRLQQGLIATVDQIVRENPRNQEARDLLVSVYQDRAPQNAGLRQWMQSHTVVANYVPAVASSNTGASTRALASTSSVGGGSIALASGATVANGEAPISGAPVSAPLSPNQVLSQPGFAPLAKLIEEHTQGTPLEGLAPEGIIGFALANTGLPAAHFNDLLYLRTMAAALPLNGFTGNMFGQSMIVATSLAHDIRRHLDGLTSASTRTSLAAGESTSETQIDAVNGLPVPAPTVASLSESGAAAPLALADRPLNGRFPSTFNFFVPSLLTSLAGMQGIAYNTAALGPSPLAGQAFGFGGSSHYYVEGPTTLDEDGNQGFGGGSQGQGSDDQGQDGREDSSHPQDSYYA